MKTAEATDDQLRIALAKAMGIAWDETTGLFPPQLDHNTLAQARQKLITTPEIRGKFLSELRWQTNAESGPDVFVSEEYKLINATPRQQAIALLRALGRAIE